MSAVALIAISLAATQAASTPDADLPTVEQAIARAIAAAMPDERYPWQLEWSPFGSYASRDIRWHLVGPVAGYERSPSPPGVTRRTGWMTISGRSVSVAACGNDDRVGALMLETDDFWLHDSDLGAELSDAGVTATLIEQRDRPALLDQVREEGRDIHPSYRAQVTAVPAYRLYRLERAGREPAFLTAEYRCTPPGTRSATHCGMHWTTELRAGAAPRSELCVAPAQPGLPQVSLD